MTATKKEKILLIENDVTFGQPIVDALAADGYTVRLVKDGNEGLTAIIDTMPHLILLDVTLPGKDGYEILTKKNAEPLLVKIPVFLVSSQGVPINMQRVPEGSVVEFLMALHSNPKDILEKVNSQFGYESLPVGAVAAETPAAGTKKKLLWVEDDKLIGTILARKFISSDFELFHAQNGEEAMNILKQVTPDGVVLDLLLPGMTGFDILQKIRMEERLKKTPVIILSNLSKPSDLEKAKILGAQKFLVKAATSLDQIVLEIKEVCK
jgi:DNA-binding response OmpR family regulator